MKLPTLLALLSLVASADSAHAPMTPVVSVIMSYNELGTSLQLFTTQENAIFGKMIENDKGGNIVSDSSSKALGTTC